MTEHKKCLFLADISITSTYYSWSLDSILDRVIGVIFGIKTSLEDKLKVIDIIANKCKVNNRNDFEFYQAYYYHENKNIQHKKLSLIKFEN